MKLFNTLVRLMYEESKCGSRGAPIMTDEKLLFMALRSNDLNKINYIFEQLYKKYKPYVAFVSANYLKDTNDIDDIIQEVFMEFFENANKVKNSIKTYLSILAKNRSIDLYRKKQKIIINDSLINFNDILDYDYRHECLKDIIKDLKASLREIEVKIILLHLLEVKTFNEISKIVSMKEKTVKTCYYRALKKIKKGGKNDD